MTAKIIIIVIILLLLVRLIYIAKTQYYIGRDKAADKIYTNIMGSPENDEQQFAQYSEAIRKKRNNATALDYYRMGSLYDYVRNDSEQAGFYYVLGLQKLKQKAKTIPLSGKDNYILNKMQDRLRLNTIYQNIIDRQQLNGQQLTLEEVPLSNQHIEAIEHELNDIAVVRMPPPAFNVGLGTQLGDMPNWIIDAQPQQPDGQPHWVSDSQNVHDSHISQDVVSQYNQIKSRIVMPQWSPTQIANYIQRPDIIQSFPAFERDNIRGAVEMLHHINDRHANISILAESEPSYIGTLFTYIMQEKNQPRRQAMLENFVNNLQDMKPTNGSPVCVNGRITRAISSLATPGLESATDDGIGILRSGQVIRNEILARAGEIRTQTLANASEVAAAEYNSGQPTQAAADLQAQILADIDARVLADYSDEKNINIQEVRREIEENL